MGISTSIDSCFAAFFSKQLLSPFRGATFIMRIKKHSSVFLLFFFSFYLFLYRVCFVFLCVFFSFGFYANSKRISREEYEKGIPFPAQLSGELCVFYIYILYLDD